MKKKRVKRDEDPDFEYHKQPLKKSKQEKHKGKVSFYCRKGCKTSFRSPQARLKHEQTVHLKSTPTGKYTIISQDIQS